MINCFTRELLGYCFSLFGGAKEEFRALEMAVEERFPLLNSCFLNIFRGKGFAQYFYGASAISLCGTKGG